MADAAPGGAPHSTTPPATKAKPRLDVGRVSGGPPGQAGSEAEHQGMRPAAFPTPRAVGQAAQTAVTETRWPASKAEGGRELRAAGPRAASQGLWPASEIWGGTEAGFTPEPPKGHAALPSGIRVTLRTYGTLSNRVLLSEATKFLDIGDDSQRKRTDVLVPRAGAAVINPRKT